MSCLGEPCGFDSSEFERWAAEGGVLIDLIADDAPWCWRNGRLRCAACRTEADDDDQATPVVDLAVRRHDDGRLEILTEHLDNDVIAVSFPMIEQLIDQHNLMVRERAAALEQIDNARADGWGACCNRLEVLGAPSQLIEAVRNSNPYSSGQAREARLRALLDTTAWPAVAATNSTERERLNGVRAFFGLEPLPLGVNLQYGEVALIDSVDWANVYPGGAYRDANGDVVSGLQQRSRALGAQPAGHQDCGGPGGRCGVCGAACSSWRAFNWSSGTLCGDCVVQPDGFPGEDFPSEGV